MRVIRRRLTAVLAGASLAAAGAADASPPTAPPAALPREAAARFATLALSCIDRPFPFKPDVVLEDADAVRLPAADHPAFYGCFDWHSAVHGHWMLVRLARLFPDAEFVPQIRGVFDRRFTADAMAGEMAFLRRREQRLFERPYGWAWALRLGAELRAWNDQQAREWARQFAPVEDLLVQRFKDYLSKLSYPVRTGIHGNTAFALGQALDYARATSESELAALIVRRAREFYGADRACPVDYEPSGEDFFSPCLLEADLMRRVLPAQEFSRWLDRFLPGLSRGRLSRLARPAVVADPTDGRIVHLDGLNLARAWTMRGVASLLPERDRRRRWLLESARAHAAAGLARVTSGSYAGEHWLASFAVYLTTDAGLAPDRGSRQ